MQHRLTAACGTAALLFGTVALAQYGGGGGAPMMVPHVTPRMETVLCPTDVQVTIAPSPAASDWSYSSATSPMHLDPANPPHVDPGMMVCYYVFVSGNNAFDYTRPLKGRTCTVRSDNTGFTCHS